MKKLKIAQVAPFWFTVPPKDYGGTERIVNFITEELVKRGHDVTLFAAEGSQTKAKLISPVTKNHLKEIHFYTDTSCDVINTYVSAYVTAHADEFDLIHSHNSFYSYFFCDFINTPVIHTLHNQLPMPLGIHNEIIRKYKYLNFVSVSNEFQSHFDLNYIAAIHHGIDTAHFPYSNTGGKHLFWIGRAGKKKGELTAIEAAKKTGKKLLLALSLRPNTEEYYKNLQANSGELITTVSNVKFSDTWRYYSRAKALLYPIEWREPFGLIFAESMACGTPVIAYGRGSVPEIIIDGITGFIVNPSESEKTGDWIIKKTGIEGLCEAIEKLYSLPEIHYQKMRKACRRHVEKNFTVKTMVDNYEKLYKEMVT